MYCSVVEKDEDDRGGVPDALFISPAGTQMRASASPIWPNRPSLLRNKANAGPARPARHFSSGAAHAQVRRCRWRTGCDLASVSESSPRVMWHSSNAGDHGTKAICESPDGRDCKHEQRHALKTDP